MTVHELVWCFFGYIAAGSIGIAIWCLLCWLVGTLFPTHDTDQIAAAATFFILLPVAFFIGMIVWAWTT